MIAFLVLSVSGSVADADAKYYVTRLGTLGGPSSYARSVNAVGQVVGCSYTSNGELHAFLFANGTMTDLGPLDASAGIATSINFTRQIAGYSAPKGSTEGVRSFLMHNGDVTHLGTLGGSDTYAKAISNTGMVAGYSSTTTGTFHAFLYSGGTMFDLGTLPGTVNSAASAVNNKGQVVGTSTGPDGRSRAFLFAHGTMSDLGSLLPGKDSAAVAVNDYGQVVGDAVNGSNQTRAFLFSDGNMTDLGVIPGALASSARSVNNYGQVVGYCQTYQGDRATIYREGVMMDLNELVDASSGWIFKQALAINDAGQIVGNGINPDGQLEAFLLTPAGNFELSAISVLPAPAPNPLPYSSSNPPNNSFLGFPPFFFDYAPASGSSFSTDPGSTETVPEPAAILLLGSGILCLVGHFSRRRMS